jgi:hypothetical protein
MLEIGHKSEIYINYNCCSGQDTFDNGLKGRRTPFTTRLTRNVRNKP